MKKVTEKEDIMKLLEFEVNEQTVKDVAFLDGDTYIITMCNPASQYVNDYCSDCFEEVWLCVLYDMSNFRLFLTDVFGEYKEISWHLSEKLMEQIKRFVS